MRILLTLALLCGCGCATDLTKPVSLAPDLATFIANPDGCHTSCGLHAPAGGDCDDLERYEREIVKSLGAAQRDWSPEKVCAAVKGYKVVLHERLPKDRICEDHGGGWVAFFTMTPMGIGVFCAKGYTDVEAKTITIEHERWRETPLAHEIVHVVENKPGHCRWASLPLRIAVSELMGEPDESVPEASLCSP